MRWRHLVVAIVTALLVGTLPSLSILSRLDGYSVDILFWLRHVSQGDRRNRGVGTLVQEVW